MLKKTLVLFLILVLTNVACDYVFAQGETLTQGQFAVKLVKSMKLYDRLPIAALPSDCVALLENMGISPLKGWDRKALLTEEDYTVIIAKAIGKENVVHTKAAEVCHRTIDVIDEAWQKYPALSLEELLSDKEIFPEGPPQCPYGLKYEDKDDNHKVDQHYHPRVFFGH